MHVGCIGLGRMGAGLCESLLRAGHVLAVYDVQDVYKRQVIPYFIAYKEMGLLDTDLGLTLIYFASNLVSIVWSLRAFMEDIPVSLEEAARIDGCSLLQTLFKISIPLATPGIASTAILSFIFSWNEFLFALLLTRNKIQTAPIGILNFIVFEKMNWGVIAAGRCV